MGRLGCVVGAVLVLLLGCSQSKVPVDLMADDPLSTDRIRGLEEVDQLKLGADTALGEFQASQFARFLRPVHGRTVDQVLVDRVAAAARRTGWAVRQTSAGGYAGRKTIDGLEVSLTISASFDDRRIGVVMVAVNEEGRD